MRAWLLLALSLPAAAQVTGWLRPEMRSTTRAAIGKAKVGLWDCEICSDFLIPMKIQRERITREAPGVPILRNAIAQDLLTRAATRDVRSLLGANGDAILGLSGGVASAFGVAAKSPTAGWIGVAMGGGQFIFRLLAKDAPNPAPYYAALLPDEITLQPGACGTWYVVSGLIKRPQPVKIVVNFGPPGPQPQPAGAKQ